MLRYFLVLALLCSVYGVVAQEDSVRLSRTGYALTKPLAIQEIKDTSAIIFLGKFEDFREHKQAGMDARSLKFRVKEALKGVDSSVNTLVLTEWARTKSPFDEDLIASDQDYVFFFYEPSSIGFTSLVGMEQGLVEVKTDKSLNFSKKMKSKKAKKKILFFNVEEDIKTYKELKDFLAS